MNTTHIPDRQPRARFTLLGVVAFVFAALLWQPLAHADLDDIRRTAEAGDRDAQLQLGILFQYGFNYKDNEIPALTWYSLSANQGHPKAIRLRDTLKAKMSEKDVQEALEQVASFKPKGTAPAPAPVPAKPESAPIAEEPAAIEPQPIPQATPETQQQENR